MKTLIWNVRVISKLSGESVQRKKVIVGLVESAAQGGKGNYVKRNGNILTVTHESLNITLVEDDDAIRVVNAFWRYD